MIAHMPLKALPKCDGESGGSADLYPKILAYLSAFYSLMMFNDQVWNDYIVHYLHSAETISSWPALFEVVCILYSSGANVDNPLSKVNNESTTPKERWPECALARAYMMQWKSMKDLLSQGLLCRFRDSLGFRAEAVARTWQIPNEDPKNRLGSAHILFDASCSPVHNPLAWHVSPCSH